MKGLRFYLEHDSAAAKRRRQHCGTVLALFADAKGRPLWRIEHRRHPQAVAEGIGALYREPNSPACSTAACSSYVSERCRRISESEARKIHPALFTYLDRQ